MTKSLATLIILLFFVLDLGCGEWGGGLPDTEVARVNQDVITVDEFDREFKELVLDSGKEEKSEVPETLKRAYLDQMIERKLLAQEARRLGIRVSAEELNLAVLEMRKDYPGKSFDERLSLQGVTLEEWRGRLEEKLLAERMMRKARRAQGTIDEKEALQYYETHRSSFELKPKVRARQIVVADGEEALQILKRLKKGENFAKLAAEKSMGPEKANGGDLGYFSQGERPAEFDQVFSMEAGQISEVIWSPYGYHIFKVEEKIEARQVPFEEAKAGILEDLERSKEEQEYQRWLKELKSKAKVEINKRLLRS
jgi:parvulin-like peptidyl-prolyl isomerase